MVHWIQWIQQHIPISHGKCWLIHILFIEFRSAPKLIPYDVCSLICSTEANGRLDWRAKVKRPALIHPLVERCFKCDRTQVPVQFYRQTHAKPKEMEMAPMAVMTVINIQKISILLYSVEFFVRVLKVYTNLK